MLECLHVSEPPRAQKPDVGFVTPREARREVGEAVEPHLQVLARLASEEELLAADGRVDWFERLVYSRGRRRGRDLGLGLGT